MKKQTKGILNGEPCPHCSKTMGKAVGPVNALALVVTDEPEFDDQGLTYPMQILRAELGRAGVDLFSLRLTSLVKHPLDKKIDCGNEHSKMLWKELEGKQLIFALGGEIVKLLTGHTSTDMNGIMTTSDLTTLPVVCGLNPAVPWHGMVGEFRLACKKFAYEYLRLGENW